MRNFGKLGVVLAFALSATGCFVAGDPAPYHDNGPPPPAPAPALDAARPLGLQGMLGYRVESNASAELPAGDLGFVITANGQGGYRVAWVSFAGNQRVFSAHITCDTTFDPTSVAGFSGREQITLAADATAIDAQSVVDGNPDGVDFVSQTDPIYVDLRIDGGPAHVYFTGADTGRLLLSSFDPVAFTSP